MRSIQKISLTLASAVSLLLTMPVLAADTYQLDPSHSFVNYEISHFGFSSQTGKWVAEGVVLLDEKDPAKSKVDITININSLVTGIPELNNHLLGPMFFDAQKYPTATFVSKKVVTKSKTTAKVYGTLTLKGVSKEVVLDVKLNKHAVNPINEKMTAGFSATTQFKRSSFGMNALLPGLSDEIRLSVAAEATRKSG